MGIFYHWKDTLPLHQSLAQIYCTVIETLFLGTCNLFATVIMRRELLFDAMYLKIKVQELGRGRIL